MDNELLPIEIWRLIIRNATLLNGIFDSAHRGRHRASDDEFDDFSLRQTKKALSLVCKVWRSIAIEFLFEALSFTTKRLAKRLLKAESNGSFPTGPNTPFRFIRCLELKWHLPENGDVTSRSSDGVTSDDYQRIVRVIQLTRNIVVFKQHVRRGALSSTLAPAIGHCAPSLRFLELSLLNLGPTFPQFLSSLTQLQYLWLKGCKSPGPAHSNDIVALPNLRSLYLDGTSLVTQVSWLTPKLSYLCLVTTRPANFPSFLEPQPMILTFDVGSCTPTSKLLTTHMTVENLTIPYNLFELPLGNCEGPFPRLHTISLDFKPIFSTVHLDHIIQLKDTFDILSSRKMFPALKYIRLDQFDPRLDPRNQVCDWSMWASSLFERGIGLLTEDSEFVVDVI